MSKILHQLVPNSSILLIAPHMNDVRTKLITEEMASFLQASYVINNGWTRTSKPDYANFKANCNDVQHVSKEPLKSEFLEVIKDYKNKLSGKKWLIYIHGMANKAGVDCVMGYGNGKPPRLTCKEQTKNLVIWNLSNNGLDAYAGATKGNFSAWDSNNLCQHLKEQCESFQLEISAFLRRTDTASKITANLLAKSVKNAYTNAKGVPISPIKYI